MVLKGEPDSPGLPASQPQRVQSLTNVPLALPSAKPSLGLPVLPSTFSMFSELSAHFFCTTGERWDPAEHGGSWQDVIT